MRDRILIIAGTALLGVYIAAGTWALTTVALGTHVALAGAAGLVGVLLAIAVVIAGYAVATDDA